MFEDTGKFPRVKLIDFGLSRIWDPQDVQGSLSRSCGSVNYMAPEVLASKYHGQKADMWSFGVISFMLISGECPFYASSCDGFTREVIQSCIKEFTFERDTSLWEKVSPEAQDFVERLLVRDPSQRMGAREALAHPWILHSCGPVGATGLEESFASRSCSHADRLLEGWRRFASFSPAARVMLTELAFSSRWTEGAVDGLQELFAQSHRGTMEFADFMKLAKQADQSVQEEELKRLFACMASARGCAKQIGYSEFLASVLPGLVSEEDLLNEVFRMLDMDNFGYITRSKFMAVFAGTSVTEAEVMYLAMLMEDSSGRISRRAFVNFLRLN